MKKYILLLASFAGFSAQLKAEIDVKSLVSKMMEARKITLTYSDRFQTSKLLGAALARKAILSTDKVGVAFLRDCMSAFEPLIEEVGFNAEGPSKPSESLTIFMNALVAPILARHATIAYCPCPEMDWYFLAIAFLTDENCAKQILQAQAFAHLDCIGQGKQAACEVSEGNKVMIPAPLYAFGLYAAFIGSEEFQEVLTTDRCFCELFKALNTEEKVWFAAQWQAFKDVLRIVAQPGFKTEILSLQHIQPTYRELEEMRYEAAQKLGLPGQREGEPYPLYAEEQEMQIQMHVVKEVLNKCIIKNPGKFLLIAQIWELMQETIEKGPVFYKEMKAFAANPDNKDLLAEINADSRKINISFIEAFSDACTAVLEV